MYLRLGIVIAVLGSAHYYVWQRFVDAPDLPSPWRSLATALILVFAPMFPMAALGTRRMSRATAAPFLLVAYTWFGFAVYLLVAAAASHVAVAFGVAARTAAAVAFVTTVVTVIYGIIHARHSIVRRVRVPLAKLPFCTNNDRTTLTL